ncbi:hypothetical protein [Methylobacterium goesingense]|uniref:hypothetical protein n=1 Tax=Methylobacterium goesingense TaxID=243690 RepID=UPI0036314791
MLCLISTVNDRLVCLRNGLSLSDAALARGTWQRVLGSGAPFDSNQALPLTNAGPNQLNGLFAADASRSIKN